MLRSSTPYIRPLSRVNGPAPTSRPISHRASQKNANPLKLPAASCNGFNSALLRADSGWRAGKAPGRQLLAKESFQQTAAFHSTPRRQGPPFFIPLLAGVLKASVSLEYVRMAARVALTIAPLAMLKNHLTKKYIKYIIKEKPELAGRKDELQKKLRKVRLLARTLFAIPIGIFLLTCLASLERTPLSGRWRLILLSPDEEETIAQQLQNGGWYRAVLEILAQDGPPVIIPTSDWRYRWVNDTLRELESIIPVLSREKFADPEKLWLERGPDDVPFPPPAKHPLRPRPNAKEYLRWFCESYICENTKLAKMSMGQTGGEDVSGKSYGYGYGQANLDAVHLVPGPPYNLILVEKPDCDNAFSFGFGPDGGGGIVVYSGFLDRILSQQQQKVCSEMQDSGTSASTLPLPPPAQASAFSFASLLGSLFALAPSQPPQKHACAPTPEQTTQLAILLAHELSHLILSHHLETLSSASVVIPGTVSFVSDMFRALLFPFTMFLGPFVNDAVADLGRAGTGEFGKLTEHCTSMAQEFEADAVSARILAHAGYDARETVQFWEHRQAATVTECSPQRAEQNAVEGASLVRRIMSATHPVHEARVARLKSELVRWETERQRHLRKIAWRSRQAGMWKWKAPYSYWTRSPEETRHAGMVKEKM